MLKFNQRFNIGIKALLFGLAVTLSAHAQAAKRLRCVDLLVRNTPTKLSLEIADRARSIFKLALKSRGVSGEDVQVVIHLARQSKLFSDAEIDDLIRPLYAKSPLENLGIEPRNNLVPEVPASVEDTDAVVSKVQWRKDNAGHIQILSNSRPTDWLATDHNLKLHSRQELVLARDEWPKSDARDYASARILNDEIASARILSDMFATRQFGALIGMATTFQDTHLMFQVMVSAYLAWKLPGKHQYFNNYLYYACDALARMDGPYRAKAIELLKEMLPDVMERLAVDESLYLNVFGLLVSAGTIQKRFAVDSAHQGLITKIEDPELKAFALAVLDKYDEDVNAHSQYRPPGIYELLLYATGRSETPEIDPVRALWALGSQAPADSLRGAAGRPEAASFWASYYRDIAHKIGENSQADFERNLTNALGEAKRGYPTHAMQYLFIADEILRMRKRSDPDGTQIEVYFNRK